MDLGNLQANALQSFNTIKEKWPNKVKIFRNCRHVRIVFKSCRY